MSAAREVQDLLTRFNLRARKSLGQNFLIDDGVFDRILDAAALTAQDTVLEIGPGLGTLTRRLAQKAAHVIAVEYDAQLMPALQYALAASPNVTLVNDDILALDPAQWMANATRYKVVANLPYQITSAVIRHLLEATRRPEVFILMVQLEVAQRMIAAPGQMSLLAVSVQFYGQPRLLKRVKADAFRPRPKVDSAIVRIDTYPQPPIEVADTTHFFNIVRAGFGQKRKQLHNALKSGLSLPSDVIDAALQSAGIDPARRAQTLALEEWARLAKQMGR
jgi:16S rRNA (adenine1518-N6/adenine1519-N6)-dimethyltransferase